MMLDVVLTPRRRSDSRCSAHGILCNKEALDIAGSMMMKCLAILSLAVASASAFLAPSTTTTAVSSHFLTPIQLHGTTTTSTDVSSRSDFLKTAAVGVAATTSLATTTLLQQPEAAQARGRATLEQSYDRYAPRIKAGGIFYSTDLKKLIAGADFAGIKNALQEPPKRSKEDLKKVDSGVAERARQAGQFSDARVLVAADLFAAAFSESSISAKTKKMQDAVSRVRTVVEEMQTVCRQALGEEKGGLFGFGAKKVDKNESAKKLRELYVKGGNAWNEYVLAANENLALQFDRFDYIK